MSEKNIEPAQTKWAAPVVFCFQERWFPTLLRRILETIAGTKRNVCPIPCIDECIHLLVEAAVFSTLNARKEYLQVCIENGDRDETVLTSHQKLYRFVRMIFEILNAFNMVQQTMVAALSEAKS